MTCETELNSRELDAEELDAVAGGEIGAGYDFKFSKKVAPPEPTPGIIAIL
jgi:hypothetical protein